MAQLHARARKHTHTHTHTHTKQPKKTLWPESVSELYQPSSRRLSAKIVPTFADRGCHVVSVTDPYSRILGFLDRHIHTTLTINNNVILYFIILLHYLITYLHSLPSQCNFIQNYFYSKMKTKLLHVSSALSHPQSPVQLVKFVILHFHRN
jgi:hypothetical protein